MTAVDEAVAHMETTRRWYGAFDVPLGDLLAAIPTDTLRRVIAEREAEPAPPR